MVIVLGHFLARRDRANRAATSTREASEIHVLVNSRLQEALYRIDVLEERLGIPHDEKYSNVGTGAT